MARSAPMVSLALICDTKQWNALQAHISAIQKMHLRDLMADAERCKAMTAEYEGIFLDYSRQQATGETMEKLFKLAKAAKIEDKIEKMFRRDWVGATGKALTNVVSVGIDSSTIEASSGSLAAAATRLFGHSRMLQSSRDFHFYNNLPSFKSTVGATATKADPSTLSAPPCSSRTSSRRSPRMT